MPKNSKCVWIIFYGVLQLKQHWQLTASQLWNPIVYSLTCMLSCPRHLYPRQRSIWVISALWYSLKSALKALHQAHLQTRLPLTLPSCSQVSRNTRKRQLRTPPFWLRNGRNNALEWTDIRSKMAREGRTVTNGSVLITLMTQPDWTN